MCIFFFSSRRRHTRCALVTGVQTCALPIYEGDALPRLLVANDPRLADFAMEVVGLEERQNLRAVHVDLDYVYDPDPAQTDRNLGILVQRIADMGVNTVFLQAFADPEGEGLVRSLYFPNRWLPMRADLFNRVAWQQIGRAHVGTPVTNAP